MNTRKGREKRRGIAWSFILLVAVAGCGSEMESDPPGVRGTETSVQRVTASAVTYRTATPDVTVSGTLEAYRRVYIAAQKSGLIQEVLVEEGDRVRRGDVLARIDDREAIAELSMAKSRLEEAERVYERNRQLYARDAISNAEYETSRSNVATARGAVDLWQTRVDFAEIRSPDNAHVVAKLVEQGNSVSLNDRLFTIEDLNDLVLRVGLSERYLSVISTGDEVRIRFDAVPGREFSGTVRRIFPRADALSRLYVTEVRVHFEQTDPLTLRPGYLGRVTFQAGDSDRILTVPRDAVSSEGGQSVLFLIDRSESRVRRVDIQTGRESGEWIEIQGDVYEGDLVVRSGHRSIESGMVVEYTEDTVR